MNRLKIFCLILISAFLFSEKAYSCCRFLADSQYSCNTINSLLNDAAGALVECRAGNRNACIRADKSIDRADVAVIQLLTECTRGNCLRGSLNPLERFASIIADRSRDLQTFSGMRRTYDNTLITVRSWQNTRPCGVQNIQQRCQQYANTAVNQHKLNISKGCGYEGRPWSSNYAGHYQWCLGASENDSHQETQARKILLDNCAVRSNNNRASSFPNLTGQWKCTRNCPAGGVGKYANIKQGQSRQLNFTNEGGGTSDGRFVDQNTVIATQWGNLQGYIKEGGRSIHWGNGTVWERR